MTLRQRLNPTPTQSSVSTFSWSRNFALGRHAYRTLRHITNPFLPVAFFFIAYQDKIDMIDNCKSKKDLEGFEDEIEIPQRKDMTNNLDASRLLEHNASLMMELDSKNGERIFVAGLACTPQRHASAVITTRTTSQAFDGVFASRSHAASFLPAIERELVGIEPEIAGGRRKRISNHPLPFPTYLRALLPQTLSRPLGSSCCSSST